MHFDVLDQRLGKMLEERVSNRLDGQNAKLDSVIQNQVTIIAILAGLEKQMVKLLEGNATPKGVSKPPEKKNPIPVKLYGKSQFKLHEKVKFKSIPTIAWHNATGIGKFQRLLILKQGIPQPLDYAFLPDDTFEVIGEHKPREGRDNNRCVPESIMVRRLRDKHHFKLLEADIERAS